MYSIQRYMDETTAQYTNEVLPAYSDDELPIQLENDALGCPRCKVELISRKSKVFVDRIDIGSFDSRSCAFCGFFLLTTKGFDESAKVIKRFGLDVQQQMHILQMPQNKPDQKNIFSTPFLSGFDWSRHTFFLDDLPCPLSFLKEIEKKSDVDTEYLSSVIVCKLPSASNRQEP